MDFESAANLLRNPVRKAFTFSEKRLLVRLIYKYSDILLNKGNGKEMSGVKKSCWRQIANEYNSPENEAEQSGRHFWRSEGQLLKCWENMKTKFKRKLVGDDPDSASWSAERKLFETFECRADLPSTASPSVKPSTSTPQVANILPANSSSAVLQQQQQRQQQQQQLQLQKQTAAIAKQQQQYQRQPPESPPVLVPIPGMQSSSSPPLISLSQDVCLRWNSYHSNMQQSFPMLLDTEQFVDVTLACEGQFIKCHKMVLSACSSFFAELFQQNPCPHPVIVLRGSRMWEIRALVDFMYRGEVNVQQDRLASLLAAAEELQVKGLAGSSGKVPDNNSSPEHSSFNHGGHSTDEAQKYQTSLQHKKILKRKAAYPQYNEPRPIRPAPASFPKMRIKPRSFANMIPEHFEDSDNSITNIKPAKKKSRVNTINPGTKHDNKFGDQNIPEEVVRVKQECMDLEDHDKNLEEILNFSTANCTMNTSTMDNTDNNMDDSASSKYSDDNNKNDIDPLEVDDERNELEDNIEEAYD